MTALRKHLADIAAIIGLLVVALIVAVTGIIMFPSRLGYNAWIRRRRKRR